MYKLSSQKRQYLEQAIYNNWYRINRSIVQQILKDFNFWCLGNGAFDNIRKNYWDEYSRQN